MKEDKKWQEFQATSLTRKLPTTHPRAAPNALGTIFFTYSRRRENVTIYDMLLGQVLPNTDNGSVNQEERHCGIVSFMFALLQDLMYLQDDWCHPVLDTTSTGHMHG